MKKYLLIILIFIGNIYASDTNIMILGTGGTIAGSSESLTTAQYSPSQFTIDFLIDSLPTNADLPNLTVEQIFQIDSQDLLPEHWLQLVKRVNELLSQDEVDGVVITHGTDTLEETAFFLNYTINHTEKPVVLAGAMQPSTQLGSDALSNLYNAIKVAEYPQSRGVLVVFNEKIFSGASVKKNHTTNKAAFESLDTGQLGQVYLGEINYYRASGLPTGWLYFDMTDINNLPQVDILYSYAGDNSYLALSAIQHGVKGIVIAGVGEGNMNPEVLLTLTDAAENGIKVVRSKRTNLGHVKRNKEINDDEYGFIVSERLNSQQSRVLLMLALTQTDDIEMIQNYFKSA